MADPLSQLRQFHISGKDIKEHNGYIIFGEHGWPKNVPTNYQVYSTDDDKSKKEYYSLECLLYFLQNKDLAHTHYVKQAGCANKSAVRRPDRMQLLAYLKGESQTASGIDKNAPIPSVRVPASEIFKKDSSSSQGTDRHPGGSGSQGSSSQGRSESGRADGVHGSSTSSSASAAKRRLPQDEDLSKVREEFAARLHEPSTKKLASTLPSESVLKTSETNESSAAISKFGPEKLAAMRAKHLAVKRTQIIDAETEPNTGQSTETGNREEMLFAMDAEKYKLIKSKEKIWRTRSSILQSHKPDAFKKSVLPMISLLNMSEEPGAAKSRSGAPPHHHDPAMMNPFTSSQQQQHQQQQAIQKSYNRYDQERFVKLDIGVEIDTKKSFVGGVSNGLPNSQPTARPPPMGLVSSNGAPRSHHHHHGDVVDRGIGRRPVKKVSSMPIIIIPATTTSIINMYNAATILEELTYVEGKPGGNKPRENEILIQRKKPDGTSAHYKVIDNPQKLEIEDWQRVVAVFVQGPAWQFKNWPWGGAPVEIFSKTKGFHLKWDEAKLDDNVAKWDVQVLELSRTKRHLDKANLMRFWALLEVFMQKYKQHLKF